MDFSWICPCRKRRSIIVSMPTSISASSLVGPASGSSLTNGHRRILLLERCYFLSMILLLTTLFLMAVLVWHNASQESQRDLHMWIRDSFANDPTATSPRTPPFSSYFNRYRPPHPRVFCFVIGPEGTGSTWVSKILPKDHTPPFSPKKGITSTIHRLWSSGPTTQVLKAQQQLTQDLKRLIPDGVRLSVLHVSAPDWDAHHYPDLHSSLWPAFYDAGLTLRVIVTVRDPAQAAHSNHRRRWKHLRSPDGKHQDIAHSARSTEMHMTLLSQQIRSLEHPHDVLVASYHHIKRDPEAQAQRIAAYLELDTHRTKLLQDQLRRTRRRASNYTTALDQSERAFLDSFFDEERCRKWAYLRQRADT